MRIQRDISFYIKQGFRIIQFHKINPDILFYILVLAILDFNLIQEKYEVSSENNRIT